MKKNTILITGGAGFIGSNFITYFLDNYSDYNIVNLDLLTYAGDLNNLKEVKGKKDYIFINGDIRNKQLVEKIFEEHDIHHVIHFAAESHVDNSITNPTIFSETNVIGTVNLIETARKHWMEKPFTYKLEYRNSRFHHISTDEVYGSLGEKGYFTEETPYAPNSPYSASKAASDMMVRSYFHTYGVNVVTTNCSNNYGPKQHDEKLIPTLIRKALRKEVLPIYGKGENVRDWLHVEDHCRAIDLVFHQGKPGETYLVGGHNEKTNIEIATFICEQLDRLLPWEKSYKTLIRYVKDRPGHDFRYAIDATKLETELLFKSSIPFEMGMKRTIDWYIDKYRKMGVI